MIVADCVVRRTSRVLRRTTGAGIRHTADGNARLAAAK
jgi:hypothetical protein